MSRGDGAERGGSRLDIGEEDVRGPDIVELIRTHLAFAAEVTPEGHVHALDVEGLARSGARFFAARRKGALLGIGAIKPVENDPRHVEVKSMHTARAARGLGVGEALLDALLADARANGAQRVSLETGTMEAFAPARRLYERAGFRTCPPFAEYSDNPFSVCMTLELVPPGPTR